MPRLPSSPAKMSQTQVCVHSSTWQIWTRTLWLPQWLFFLLFLWKLLLWFPWFESGDASCPPQRQESVHAINFISLKSKNSAYIVYDCKSRSVPSLNFTFRSSTSKQFKHNSMRFQWTWPTNSRRMNMEKLHKLRLQPNQFVVVLGRISMEHLFVTPPPADRLGVLIASQGVKLSQ